jgi:RNA polymerase sigma-70 factor (ECF subfamily)
MSTRNLTVTDLQRLDALAGDAEVAFQMDEQTFRAFYDRTARPLWAYLSRMTGDRQLSDDLLQDAYYRFLRADATYENEAHRRNALFRIATNLARDSHRRARVRPLSKVNDADDVTMVADHRVDVEGQLQRKTDLGRAMQQLKPRERALLWLAYAEGSSHREIATAVGVKLASVKLLLFRARRKLAGLLEERASS